MIRPTMEEIDTILEKHVKYLKNKPDGERADFSFCDLNNVDFSYKDLSFAIFHGADLYNANFAHCNLECSEFNYACLIKTCFLLHD